MSFCILHFLGRFFNFGCWLIIAYTDDVQMGPGTNHKTLRKRNHKKKCVAYIPQEPNSLWLHKKMISNWHTVVITSGPICTSSVYAIISQQPKLKNLPKTQWVRLLRDISDTFFFVITFSQRLVVSPWFSPGICMLPKR
jgi:hypothetical protein